MLLRGKTVSKKTGKSFCSLLFFLLLIAESQMVYVSKKCNKENHENLPDVKGICKPSSPQKIPGIIHAKNLQEHFATFEAK
ncbi:CLUMA_CG021164, isoform A [Clunio marinus]|uniref:CLUMA_CG021164, isoform A n=1 Tax=Clunio marinus TaxID=568069 RepID=A0A1J1JA95_9DIPT|nr:CLUMA_CG021164, isoform A [Clunio marinus]